MQSCSSSLVVDSRSISLISALAELTFAVFVGRYSFFGEGFLFHTWYVYGTPINSWRDESFFLLVVKRLDG